MTKLTEWLLFITVLFSVWAGLLLKTDQKSCCYNLILYSPVICIILFGLYAASVVLYRTFTFNNCEEAAAELKKEIRQAKEELVKLGFKFKQASS